MTQAQALNILKTGANVFLTGEPGAGKTYVINEYVQYLREHAIEPAITASTGIAATHIHGSTIHSWSGIGIRKYLNPYDLETIATTEYLVRRIRNTAVLIIDEISMIDAATLDMVDQVCREVRQKPDAFGGMQVILVGDFFQLPPVTKNDETPAFAFRSNAWSAMRPIVCYLSEQHRQSDEKFLSILAAIRNDTFDEEHHDHLQQRIMQSDTILDDGATLTRLFSHNVDVDSINDTQLDRLDGMPNVYTMTSKGSASLVANLKKGCLSPETLVLKEGAAVMCTKNNREKDFANGTLGIVVDFAGGTNYPIIETRHGRRITIEPMDWVIEEDGKIKAAITQLPLRLAWAITIHKSQGMSLDAALMDLSQVFEYGQGYVALSRVRSLSGLHLLGYSAQSFKVHPTILAEDESFQNLSDHAAHSFASLEKSRLQEMHDNFIKASGGNLVKQARGTKKLKSAAGKKDTLEETRVLVLEGKSIKDIAKARKLVFVTVVSHIEKLIETGKLTFEDIDYIITPTLRKVLPALEDAFEKHGTEFLAPVHEALKGKYDYDTLRLARLVIKAKKI